MSQGQTDAAFLGQASYNMGAAMVTEISDFKVHSEPTSEAWTTLQSGLKIRSVKTPK